MQGSTQHDIAHVETFKHGAKYHTVYIVQILLQIYEGFWHHNLYT